MRRGVDEGVYALKGDCPKFLCGYRGPYVPRVPVFFSIVDMQIRQNVMLRATSPYTRKTPRSNVYGETTTLGRMYGGL